ncbi:MAG: hypothetical protein JWQ68_2434 [Cryobacterium sp.]|jgi:hypothetical protein|nr:hypothetical protein [Cryobacterium sp.]
MPYFLVEIPVRMPHRREMERASRTLRSARSRLTGTSIAAPFLMVAATADNAGLVFLVKAPSVAAVRQLVTLALLPGGRIRELSHRDWALVCGSPESPGQTQLPIPVRELSPSLFRML